MTTPQEILKETLDNLGKEDFETFRWYLNQEGVLEDFTSISKSHLEKATRINTVDQMVQTYGTMNVLKVTEIILMKMKKTELVKKISGSIKEPTDPKRDTEQRVQPQSVQPEDWLFAVRRQLVDGLSDVTVNQLLDRLYEQRVIGREEMNVIRAQTAADKARQLIDWVQQKGSDAASVLKTALPEVDPFLFKKLNLTQKQ